LTIIKQETFAQACHNPNFSTLDAYEADDLFKPANYLTMM